jgi:diguanylate cyclase (GGDEF)-like protein
MSQPQPSDVGRRRPKLAARMREAALWKTPRSAVLLILSIETLCVTWLVISNALERPGLADFGRFALLFFVAILYTEGANRIELLRRYVAQVTFAGVTSLWTMCAALVLPVGLAGAFAVVLFAYTVGRLIKTRSGTPFRAIYVAASDVTATMAAATVVAYFHAGEGAFANGPIAALAVVLAMFTYPVVQQGLVTGAIYLATRPTRLRGVMLNREEQVMELSTYTMAVLFAIALVHAPYLSPLVLVLVVVLRRSALVQELQVQATRDAKTGLLNAGAWRQEAERLIIRSERMSGSMSVVMLDLDHFKVLNDTFGHQAGDTTLHAIAQCLSDALRGYDAIGRFGGEEFIALLNDADEVVSRAVAERLCTRIRELKLAHGSGVTASIGVGVGAAGVNTLDELIAIADRALYVAKGSGRDQVHVESAPSPVRARSDAANLSTPVRVTRKY